MNYRHIYHAGNFADVLKHAVLALMIEHLKLKDAPVRVIDTHAGVGLYDLASEQAQKTGEWRDGIGRILASERPTSIDALLAPYLKVVAAENGGSLDLLRYPGSPLIARRLMRRDDSLVVNETHSEDAERLAEVFANDRQTKVLSLDGWTALKALLPPKERRGLVLIDPPFEERNEFKRLSNGLVEAHRRFATGTVMLWYPVKDARAVEKFLQDVAALGIAKLLAVELCVDTPGAGSGMVGTGLVILNPPFTLEAKLQELLPYLATILARGGGAEHRMRWLAGEHITSS